MNLRSLDLNLLVVLDALLQEAHVSRAAERLNLSQPATSAALQRCRELFRDPLLDRGRGTMRLTPRAEALRAPLRSLLAEVRSLVDPPATPLAELRQTLRLAMADFPAAFLIGPLHQALRHSAPGIDLVLQPWQGRGSAEAALLEGQTDIALSVVLAEHDQLHREELLREHFLTVMRQDHPAAANFGLEAWLRYPHIIVSGRGEARGPLDVALAERGLTRRVGLAVPNFGMVPPLLAESDLIALLPSRCVPRGPGFVALPPPMPVEGFGLHLAWHRRRRGDAGLQHVAGLLRQFLM
ncbi:LysR family transcriptional regulator [Roseomonas sp. F4]